MLAHEFIDRVVYHPLDTTRDIYHLAQGAARMAVHPLDTLSKMQTVLRDQFQLTIVHPATDVAQQTLDQCRRTVDSVIVPRVQHARHVYGECRTSVDRVVQPPVTVAHRVLSACRREMDRILEPRIAALYSTYMDYRRDHVDPHVEQAVRICTACKNHVEEGLRPGVQSAQTMYSHGRQTVDGTYDKLRDTTQRALGICQTCVEHVIQPPLHAGRTLADATNDYLVNPQLRRARELYTGAVQIAEDVAHGAGLTAGATADRVLDAVEVLMDDWVPPVPPEDYIGFASDMDGIDLTPPTPSQESSSSSSSAVQVEMEDQRDIKKRVFTLSHNLQHRIAAHTLTKLRQLLAMRHTAEEMRILRETKQTVRAAFTNLSLMHQRVLDLLHQTISSKTDKTASDDSADTPTPADATAPTVATIPIHATLTELRQNMQSEIEGLVSYIRQRLSGLPVYVRAHLQPTIERIREKLLTAGEEHDGRDPMEEIAWDETLRRARLLARTLAEQLPLVETTLRHLEYCSRWSMEKSEGSASCGISPSSSDRWGRRCGRRGSVRSGKSAFDCRCLIL